MANESLDSKLTNLEKLEAFDSMLKGNGWGLMHEWLTKMQAVQMNNILALKGQDRDEAVGFYKAITQIKEYPVNMGRLLKDAPPL